MSLFLSGLSSLLGSLALIFAFAWAARALLGARELSWRRLMLAAVAGIAVGQGVALFLVVSDVSELETLDLAELSVVAFPFQVIATMGAIVVLELARARGRSRSRRRPSIRSLRVGLGVIARAVAVFRITSRHGLAPLIGLRRSGQETRAPNELARRTRVALEEAGGMFIKLGQLLATRPDLVPPAAQTELGRLHSSASPLPREAVERLIEEELGRSVDEVFAEVDWNPLGSASIAQAHSARLVDGTAVVVKVRRPGLKVTAARDLAITRWLARTAARRTRWGEALDVEALAAEFGRALEDELDLRIEAGYLQEMEAAVGNDSLIRVPRVIPGLTFEGLLVMERLDGTPLSQTPADELADGRRLADALTASQVGAMMRGDRFHGDPHPGNLLLLEDGRLGLIDMGISGRLDAFEKEAVFQMLVALRHEQPTLLYESMMSIGAIDPSVHDADVIVRALARFMAAHLGPGLPSPEALTALMRLTTELGLRLPRSTMAMFRALATLTGTLEHLSPGYPVVDVVADLGGDELRRRVMPESAIEFVQQEWPELGPLVSRLPRHVDRVATMLEHGRLTTRVRLFSHPDEQRFVQGLVNLLVLTLLSVGTGAVSVMLIALDDDRIFGLFGNVGLYEALGWIGLFIAVSLLMRVLLSVLRSEG